MPRSPQVVVLMRSLLFLVKRAYFHSKHECENKRVAKWVPRKCMKRKGRAPTNGPRRRRARLLELWDRLQIATGVRRVFRFLADATVSFLVSCGGGGCRRPASVLAGQLDRSTFVAR